MLTENGWADFSSEFLCLLCSLSMCRRRLCFVSYLQRLNGGQGSNRRNQSHAPHYSPCISSRKSKSSQKWREDLWSMISLRPPMSIYWLTLSSVEHQSIALFLCRWPVSRALRDYFYGLLFPKCIRERISGQPPLLGPIAASLAQLQNSRDITSLVLSWERERRFRTGYLPVWACTPLSISCLPQGAAQSVNGMQFNSLKSRLGSSTSEELFLVPGSRSHLLVQRDSETLLNRDSDQSVSCSLPLISN